MILSKSDAEKIDIDKFIYNKLNAGKINEVLIIVPTNRKVRYLKREFISNVPGKTIAGLKLETLSTLSTVLFDNLIQTKAKILSDAASVIIINQAVAEIELEFFNHYKREFPRGTLEMLHNVLNEYKRLGITPEQIRIESERLKGSEKHKAADIANIYAEYQKKITALNSFELGDIYSYLIKTEYEKFKSVFYSVYPDVNTIVINGFDEFSQPEIELVNRLADFEKSNLFLSFDFFRYNPEIFSHLELCYKSFLGIGFREIEDISANEFDNFRQKIREKLFIPGKKEKTSSRIELVKAVLPTQQKEIEFIAKEIKRLLTIEQISADEICVAINLISNHSAMINDIFSNYGIPYNLTDRDTLSSSPPVIALINLLEIQQNDFYYKNIFRALSGRWIEIHNVNLANLLLVASNLKLTTGYYNWINSIDSLIDQIESDMNDDENNFLPVWKYQSAKNDIEKIHKLLKPFGKKQTIDEFRNNIKELLEQLNISSKLVNDNFINIEKNIKAVTVFIETLDEVFSLLNDEYGRSTKLPLSFFLNEMKIAAAFSRYNIKERHGNGVLVTSVNEIRGLRFRYLFLCGMIDGDFPTRYKPAIFFSGEHRKRRDELRHLLEERYRFYQALCVPDRKLYFSYSVKGEKKENTESSFLTELEKHFYLITETGSSLENYIYSNSELLKAAGKNADEIIIDEKLREKIKNDVAVDKLRTGNPFAESEFTGYINEQLSDNAKSVLLSFSEKEFSASQLEEYAKCPFRYFLNRVLALDTVEEPTEEFEAFELGSLIHSILYKFYSEIHSQGITLAGCSEEDFIKSEKLLFNIADEKVKSIRFNSPASFFDREKIFGINGQKENSILYQFLLTERSSEKDYLPKYFEYAFNNVLNSSNSQTKTDGIKLRGKVDRIDINEHSKTFKVVDYKLSGKKPTKEDLITGISLQLPLYMFASKLLIQAELNLEFNPSAAEIYSLKLIQKDFGRKAVSIESKKNLNDGQLIDMNNKMIDIALNSVSSYVEKIINGDFRLSQLENRENKICRYCEFKSICRIQEVD